MWCFDLELNQPSSKIIQIGGVIGDLLKGHIIDTFNYYINPHEKLGAISDGTSMTDFTGITQQQVDTGLELQMAVDLMKKKIDDSHCCKSPVVWGNGDLRALKQQDGRNIFQIHRELDVKTVFQFDALANGKSMRGGLEKSMQSYGLKFEGRPHNALDDAKNTFLFAHHLTKMLKSTTK